MTEKDVKSICGKSLVITNMKTDSKGNVLDGKATIRKSKKTYRDKKFKLR